MIHRRSRPRVPNGLTFRTSATEHVPIEDTARNLKQSEGSEASPESRVERRFIAQSGRSSGDADMSMLTYLEERMNRVNRIDDDLVSKGAEIAESQNSTLSTLSKPFRRHPAELGKLHEIDLGPSTTKENVVRTEVAAMRLNTGSDTTPSAPPGREARNTGPSPKRRKKMPKTTTDLYRDKLVEEVCTESRNAIAVNFYDDPTVASTADGDEAADDRIAEQFRRDFIEAIAMRHTKRSAASAQAGARGEKVEERAKGPKLGGSRSARASMRASGKKLAPDGPGP